MHTQSWSHSQLFLAPGDDSSYNASLNKPLSRIDTIIASHAPEISDTEKDQGLHYCTWLYGGNGYGVEDFQYQFQIGSSRFPQAPVVGFSQVYYRNLEALGIKNSGSHSIGVDMESFKTNHFIMALDVSKVPGVKASGESSQNGQELRVSAQKFSDPGQAAQKARRLYMAILSDVIYEIRAGSISKLD